MKVKLMFPDRNFEYDKSMPQDAGCLEKDLALENILSAMAAGDEFIYSVCRQALLQPLESREEIIYRQDILKDCIENPQALRRLYAICTDTEQRRKSSWYRLSSSRVSTTFSSAAELLNLYISALGELRKAADGFSGSFKSAGFRGFFSMLQEELSDDYFARVKSLMQDLGTGGGILIGAGFGSFLQGRDYTCLDKKNSASRLRWLMAPAYILPERDDAGAADLYIRKERALNEPADALAKSALHLGGFMEELKTELAFYLGALNLREQTEGTALSFPLMLPAEKQCRAWKKLRDGSLVLSRIDGVVGNDMEEREGLLYIITGANQGGKTTFLRSLGQAQLMGQSGLFVFAESFTAPIRRGIFSHFKREEDSLMESGKLDEELRRMSRIADSLKRGSLVLFNESFASTNEREGSEIFSQITRALVESGTEVFSVTHLNMYASAFSDAPEACFLRALRLPDGRRSYKISPGRPLETAYGEDIYKKIFGEPKG